MIQHEALAKANGAHIIVCRGDGPEGRYAMLSILSEFYKIPQTGLFLRYTTDSTVNRPLPSRLALNSTSQHVGCQLRTVYDMPRRRSGSESGGLESLYAYASV
ncbi:hypothetical protein PLICRDRAFT_39753 [Plicaturopsis crispa FD-325 SS-3]|nr:hypothetical protein PLICRDRAFT_39753 [Plicaturopsis crispa FD-325 SS-3]